MQVKKRNGSFEPVSLDKIVNSLERISTGLKNVDVFKIAKKTVGGLVDGVTTRELDMLSIRTAVGLIIEDPEYSKFAARILSNVIAKEVGGQDIQSFSQSIKIGFEQGLINEKTFNLVMTNKRKLNAAIKQNRDNLYEFHGMITLYDRYLLKHRTLIVGEGTDKRRAVIETPQYFLMRVACGLSETAQEAVEFYNLLSSLEYMTSTPTLFNSGTTHSQMSSCFIAGTRVVTINEGLKNIEEVNIGDLVLTHKGNIKPVVQLHKNKLDNRQLYDIEFSLNNIKLTVTGNHKLWVISGGDPTPCWKRVDELNIDKDLVAWCNQPNKSFIYTEIKTIKTNPSTPDYVYTLGVADDHSYTVEGIIAENCYLLDSPMDDLKDIYKRYSDVARLSKFAGGIGVSASRIRSAGSPIIGTNGRSNGIVPWLHTLSASVGAVNQCLHPNTKIYTKDGLKNISEIKKGDFVLGNSGHYCMVDDVLVYQKSEEKSLEITVDNTDDKMYVTDGHPFYVLSNLPNFETSEQLLERLNKLDIVPIWTDACELNVGDFLSIPISQDTPNYIEIHETDMVYNNMIWRKITNIKQTSTPEYVYDLKVAHDETYTVSGGLVHNGGKRKGAACVYLETHHADIMQFLELRDNTGEKELRAYNLNIANWISDLFMKRVKNDEIWSLFDPADCPELTDLYGDEYEKRYIELEQEQKYKLQVPARKIYSRMMRTLAETGNGWMCFKDTSNKRGNQVGDAGIIHLSNLCTEILELTSSGTRKLISRSEFDKLSKDELLYKNLNVVGYDNATDSFEVMEGTEVAVCNLGSINIGRGYIKNGKLDKEKLRKNVDIAVKYLDRVIDRNFYPVPESEASNNRWRPIGLGLMGLSDLFFQLRLPFESLEAQQLSAEIQEEIYYQALKTSMELSKEYGPHRDFELTKAAKGQLQFDLVEGARLVDPERWDELRNNIIEHGLRNSLLIAIAPTATISHIVGAEECIEPIKSNLLKRETLSGEFVSINKYLVDDLKKIDMWNAETRRLLTQDEGSVQKMNIPDELKELYKTVWEMSQKSIINHAAKRGVFIDQSQSLNLFIDLNKYQENKRIGVLSSLYMYAWENGCKTTYYLRGKSASRIEKVTITHVEDKIQSAPENPDVCESCQ